MNFRSKILLSAGKILLNVGLIGILSTLVGYFWLKSLTKEVTMIVLHDPIVIETNRSLYNPDDQVIEIYGNPMKNKVKVVVFNQSKIIHPKEDSSLALYPVDKQKGDNPLQWQTVKLVFVSVILLFIIDSVIGFYLMRFAKSSIRIS
ncbi:MAG: hypothetical protein N2450_04150 [bacterium]|nr:hypothetical protein [bacterium]